MTSPGFEMVAGLSIALGLLSGCIIKEEEPAETGGSSGVEGDGFEMTTRRPAAGQGGGAGTASGSAGTSSVASAVDATCDEVEPLPTSIETDLTVGPGCVRIGHTAVNGAARLTVLPGTRVEFLAGGFLSVAAYGGTATLAAIGTADEPIVFTSSNENPRAGDWQCLHLGADGSELDHAIVEYGGAPCGATGAGSEGMLQIYGNPRGVTNSILSDSSTVAVQLEGTPTLFQNNVFQRNAEAPIRASSNSLTSIGTPNTYDADDVILVEADLVTRSGTWQNPGVPYRFMGGFGIQGKISVAAGVRVEMTDGSLDVSTFDLLGTAEAPVVFTSAQEEPRPGDWGCIYSGAALRIEHAVFEYAGSGQGCTGGDYRVALMADGGTTIIDTVFRNISGAAFYSDCGTDLSAWCANTFENVSEGPIACGNELTACP
jgi:hypothetical protein